MTYRLALLPPAPGDKEEASVLSQLIVIHLGEKKDKQKKG